MNPTVPPFRRSLARSIQNGRMSLISSARISARSSWSADSTRIAGPLAPCQVAFDEGVALLDAGGRVERVLRRLHCIVQESRHRRLGDVDARVGRGVVDEETSVVVRDPAAAEDDVGDVTYALLSLGCDEIAGGLVGHEPGLVEIGHE